MKVISLLRMGNTDNELGIEVFLFSELASRHYEKRSHPDFYFRKSRIPALDAFTLPVAKVKIRQKQ